MAAASPRADDDAYFVPKGDYHRVVVEGDDGDADYLKAAEKLARALKMRDAYKDVDKGQQESLADIDESKCVLEMKDGVFEVTGVQTTLVSWEKYIEDIKAIFDLLEVGPWLSVCRTRLTVLEEKFELYSLLNRELEEAHSVLDRGGGVHSRGVKVDNSVKLSTAMDARTLIDHIVQTARDNADETVKRDQDGHPMSLRDLMEDVGLLDPQNITVEGFGLHPRQRKRFDQFDILDPELNRSGGAEVLQVFLQPHGTVNNGRFFADLIRPLFERFDPHFNDSDSGPAIASEYKIPISGASMDEWHKMAHWLKDNFLMSFNHNMWVIHVQRNSRNRSSFEIETNADQLRNLFEPLFNATLYPKDPEFGAIAEMLKHVGAITITSDEAFRKKNLHSTARPPHLVPWSEIPDDYYFFYYVWCNVAKLNALRKKRGLNLIQFRPTCGENTPHFDQLVCSYLLSDSICQGIKLESSWVLQYLYLMARIGICMSPISNNNACFSYFENPFLVFFKRGLLVTLATDDPLHYHHGDVPLLEEYSTAQKMYQLTAMDMSEIARNSVLVSSFSEDQKCEWVGSLDWNGGGESKSLVCDFRLQFRHDCLLHEQALMNFILEQACKSGLPMNIARFVKAPRNHVARQPHHQLNYVDRRVMFPRVSVGNRIVDPHVILPAVEAIRRATQLRQRYKNESAPHQRHDASVRVEDVFRSDGGFVPSAFDYAMYYGVCIIGKAGTAPTWPSFIPSIERFIEDVDAMRDVVHSRQVEEHARQRLVLLEHKFRLHLAMNIGREAGNLKEKTTNNRDFYTARKVDTNVHTDASMNARLLFHFFEDKAKNAGHDVVLFEDNRPVTLRQLLSKMKINVERLTVDELTSLLRVDLTLRSIFFSTDNVLGGRYFAELTKLVLENNKLDEWVFSENRLEITGARSTEWSNLAAWFDKYGMASTQTQWMIRIPRSYRQLKRSGDVKDFGDFLENIFNPLWEVSLRPAEHTKFHYMLCHISGFDCVGDEQKVDLPLSATPPHEWNSELNPPYDYYMYYLWANIVSLNEFRTRRGLNAFSFRPQCGENGSVEHLISGYLVADGISHGVTLGRNPVLEYCFYVSQVGIAISPLSNTERSIDYLENPFPKFFHRGLNVSLATNDPLAYHFTSEPLIEEYAIASKVWKLSNNDLCEVAKNSVLQSGFTPKWKADALGRTYYLHSSLGNDVRVSRLSDIRVTYRFEVYHTECNYLDAVLASPAAVGDESREKMPRAMKLLVDEVAEYEAETGFIVPDPDSKDNNIASGLDRLQMQLDNLAKQVTEAKTELHDVTAQNTVYAAEIVKARRRVDDASSQPISVRAGLGSSDTDVEHQ